MRRPVIAGNWKRYKGVRETVEFVEELKPLVKTCTHCDIIVTAPFTALWVAAEAARESPIAIGAQDLYWEREGAFTGEISAPMVADAGCRYSILGHSERRGYFGETSLEVNKKVRSALQSGLIPIICLGEQLVEWETNQTRKVVEAQFSQSLGGLTPKAVSRTIVAYEPVWAIGTGRTATPEIAQDVHAYIRQLASEAFGYQVAQSLRVLYGGSVKPVNIAGLMAQNDIDGALVGGASLKAESFASIIKFSAK